jgi:hypothetical protein
MEASSTDVRALIGTPSQSRPKTNILWTLDYDGYVGDDIP